MQDRLAQIGVKADELLIEDVDPDYEAFLDNHPDGVYTPSNELAELKQMLLDMQQQMTAMMNVINATGQAMGQLYAQNQMLLNQQMTTEEELTNQYNN